MTDNTEWQRVAGLDELPEGRVKTVTAGVHSMTLNWCKPIKRTNRS